MCPVCEHFLERHTPANPSRKSRILTLYENRGTRIFYPLTLRLMRTTSICDTSGRLAGWLTCVSLKSSIPHFSSIALRDVAPRIPISENIRTISSVLRKYILHHSEHFKHRSITALIVSFVRQNTSSPGLLTRSRFDRC